MIVPLPEGLSLVIIFKTQLKSRRNIEYNIAVIKTVIDLQSQGNEDETKQENQLFYDSRLEERDGNVWLY